MALDWMGTDFKFHSLTVNKRDRLYTNCTLPYCLLLVVMVSWHVFCVLPTVREHVTSLEDQIIVWTHRYLVLS